MKECLVPRNHLERGAHSLGTKRAVPGQQVLSSCFPTKEPFKILRHGRVLCLGQEVEGRLGHPSRGEVVRGFQAHPEGSAR